MTRKRKVDNQSENSTADNKKDRLSEYGYQKPTEQGSSTNPSGSVSNNQFRRSFPHKGRGGGDGFRSRGGQRNHRFSREESRSYDDKDFDRKYGMVGGGNEAEVCESMREGEEKGDKNTYPAELVAYLKNIEQMIATDGHVDNMVIDKCAEECSGEEEKLLSFRDSSIVVENVFGSLQHGAELFLSGLARLKHKRLLDLFFSGTSAHAIETLFYALLPIKSSRPVELIEKFSDLLCDNWNDAVTCQHSAFLVRCFARVTCGLKKKDKSTQDGSSNTASVEGQSADIKHGLSRVFDRIASLALESAASPRVENVHLSLVVQDVLEADCIAKLGKSTVLVDKILSTSSENDLRQLWLGKNSSRVWERLVVTCNEETLQSLWETVLAGHVAELAAHPCANFPLQKFIGSVKSLELATDVCDEATPLVKKFLSNDRWGVCEALLRCVARHEELQEPLLKELRRYFNASKLLRDDDIIVKKENKLNFLLNVVTLNKYNGKNFNVNDSHLHGCLLLEVLLSFHKIKTLTACLEALPASDIVQLAKNRCGSHVLQAAFRSKTLGDDVKETLIKVFEDDWGSLMSDVYGSHVFESIWECSLFTVNRRQLLMKKLVPIHNDSKFWKFAMLRCDMYLFRKDRKAWVEKMKKSVKEAKH